MQTDVRLGFQDRGHLIDHLEHREREVVGRVLPPGSHAGKGEELAVACRDSLVRAGADHCVIRRVAVDPEALEDLLALLAIHASGNRPLPVREEVLVHPAEGDARPGIVLVAHHQHVREPERLQRLPEGVCRFPGNPGKRAGHLQELLAARPVRRLPGECSTEGGVARRQVARHGCRRAHGAKLGAFRAPSFPRRQCVELSLYVARDVLPAPAEDARIVRDQVTARGSRISVAMVMQPLDRPSRAAPAHHQTVERRRFPARHAGRGHEIEPGSGNQVSREELAGKISRHDLPHEPRPTLRNAP